VSNESAVEVAQRAHALVGEGPVWLAAQRRVFWIDIKGLKIHAVDPSTGRAEMWPTAERIGALIPRARGGFVALAKSGVKICDVPFDRLDAVMHPDRDRPGNRFNDAKCDPRGRLWAGTMDDAEVEASGRLYRIDDLQTVTCVKDRVNLSNGLGWSPDGRTMYFVETLRGVIWAYDYDVADGAVTNERVFARVPQSEGYPDGICVDADGCVWLAHWGGWRLTRFAPDGRIARVLNLPVPQVTSCAFGGVHLDTLYITSASIGLDAAALNAAPLSGSLFACRVGVGGLPVAPFRA
jgi:sugar lactone lactonase YvrE